MTLYFVILVNKASRESLVNEQKGGGRQIFEYSKPARHNRNGELTNITSYDML